MYGIATTQLHCPLFNTQGQPLGVLICARENHRSYDPEDYQMLTQIAQSVATALERIISVQQLQMQLLEHQHLLSLARMLNTNNNQSASETIDQALAHLRDLVKADYIQVNKRQNLQFSLAFETKQSLYPEHSPKQYEFPIWMIEKSPVIRAVVRGETVHVTNTADHKILRRIMAEIGYLSFWSTSFNQNHDSAIQLSIFRCQIGGWNNDEQYLLETAARMLGAVIQRHQDQEELHHAYQSAIHTAGLMLESRDYETAGHTDRVVSLAMRFAKILKLSDQEIQDLRWGAYLHDIGKIIIPDQILKKPTTLTKQERDVIESHVIHGEKIANTLAFLSNNTRAVIRSHHERIDGAGYPDKLKGNQIPLLARMFAICDVYDAMRHERPYKKAMSRNDTTLNLLQSSENGHLDPYLVQIFLEMLEEIQVGHTLQN
jgi:putative nucleotidyltransferase with HDIG domain